MLKNIWESTSSREPHQLRAIVKEACRAVHTYLTKQGKLPRITPTNRRSTVCFAQPHTNVRGIRFAAWILSLVIAEANDIHYIWSSDSDTTVIGNCIQEAVKILEGASNMGGISTAISVQRAPKSTAALLAWTQHRCLIYLDAAFTASIGHSSCLTGPSTLYRAEALAQAIMFWYLANDASDGSSPRMMANDDNQITTCLGRLGWKRGYLTDYHVQTCAPGSLLDWIRQQCRWNRAYNHERFNHFWYSVDQGPLYLWWIVRDEVYDAMFMANLLCLICGMPLYAPYLSEWVAYFVAQPLYNYVRSPETERRFSDLLSLPWLVVLHHLSIQFVHVWSTLTPFEDVDNTPAGERGSAAKVALSARDIAYMSWITITGLFSVRLAAKHIGITLF
ncbi:glycosyltransferase family 2 protein [Alternaria alternata]|nr:glycosyltransferase family 2 protein [Alternaria alternata]